MKRYIRSDLNIDPNTIEPRDTIYINSVEDFMEFKDMWIALSTGFPTGTHPYEGRFAGNFDLKFKLIFSDEALNSCCDYMGISDFLYRLKQWATNFSKLKSQLSSITSEFYYDIDTEYRQFAKDTFKSISDNIRSLKILGLTVPKIGRDAIKVQYFLDPQRYDIQSPQFSSNYEKITEMLESIPVVCRVDGSNTYSGGMAAWYCYISKDESLGTYPQIVPELHAVPIQSGTVSYNVSVVMPPQYMSRLPFRYAEPNQEMYMIATSKFNTESANVSDFVFELYHNPPISPDSWDELFDYLDSQMYKSNGALITNYVPCKIVQTMDGKSKTIYKKELPNSTNISQD